MEQKVGTNMIQRMKWMNEQSNDQLTSAVQ